LTKNETSIIQIVRYISTVQLPQNEQQAQVLYNETIDFRLEYETKIRGMYILISCHLPINSEINNNVEGKISTI